MPRQFTSDGHPLSHVVSAYQKAVRRCEPELTMYFGLQIWERYPGYLMRRSCVVAAEDIGMANLPLVSRVFGLYSTWTLTSISKKKASVALRRQEGRPAVARMLWDMGESPKSRESDDFLHHLVRSGRLGLEPRPPLAPFRDMMDGFAAAVVAGDEVAAGMYAVELSIAYTTRFWSALPGLVAEMYSDGFLTELVTHFSNAVLETYWYSNGYDGACIGLVALLLARSDKDTRFAEALDALDAHGPYDVPEWAFDHHTSEGRARGYTTPQRFVEYTSKVANEAYPSAYLLYDPTHGMAGATADFTLVEHHLKMTDEGEQLDQQPRIPQTHQRGLFD